MIGCGRIGREVALRALAFDMRVLAFDPFLTDEQAAKLGVQRVASVAEMLPQCDYLTVHTPLTPETKYLINSRNLSELKRGVRLINCARGGIYEEAALVEGLNSGQIAGVALDVFEEEPCTNSPLFSMPGVVATPHLGASTEEAQTQVAVEGIHLLINFFKTGEIRHSVNVSALDPKTLAALRSHLNVAYRLGLLLSQWHGGNIAKCQLTYRGEVADRDTKLLTNAFCVGLLERALEDVNIINAEMLLRERGIELTEHVIRDMGAFSSSIGAAVSGDQRDVNASGTVFGHDMPRLIMLGDHRLEAYIDGIMLIFTHRDVPGIIGRVGTIFGKHSINIAQMSVGRDSDAAGGQAIGVLNLDSQPSDAAIQEVSKIDGIETVHCLTLPAAGALPAWLK